MADVHHLLPRTTEFRKYFDDANLNSEDFMIDLPPEMHTRLPDGIHTGQGTGRGGAWNQAWREFFKNNPNASREQILEQVNKMADRFGLHPYDLKNILKQGEEPIEWL